MHQHLLTGMYAPLGLVLGAPVTLLLRTLPAGSRWRIGRLLRSRPVHLVVNPIIALGLNLGGLAALYFTPLYLATAAARPCTTWFRCTSCWPAACSPGSSQVRTRRPTDLVFRPDSSH